MPASTRTSLKRKASDTATSQDSTAEPRRKASKGSHKHKDTEVDAQLPATPQTLDKGMESDDDFNSVASSMDLGEEMSSSVDFGAAGMCDMLRGGVLEPR
jgi:hypothetical protein